MLSPSPLSASEIVAKALNQEELTPPEGLALLLLEAPEDWQALQQAGDRLRSDLVGETVTYVINRNINFTNICEQHCGFCAFRRHENEAGAFWLDQSTILAKAEAAVAQGATEICMQGGLNPRSKIQGSSLGFYQQLVRSIKDNFPQLHLHAFSPQEIQFIAREDGLDWRTVLMSLQEVGLDSLPGTAAEVLVDEVRRVICPEKIDSQTWLAIVALAHQLGLFTTSTLLCGHIETPAQQIAHLEQLRQLQKQGRTEGWPGGITEFILLPFVGEQAPKALKNRVGRPQPDLWATLKLTAVARLYLGRWVPNHQPSWVKLGLAGATKALSWGCNDLGGTLMEEHITTLAGAKGGTALSVEQLQQAISSCERPFRQRTTLYDWVATQRRANSTGQVALTRM
jgi:FO synthase subunit 2